MQRRVSVALLLAALIVAMPAEAMAQEDCRRAVIFALPGITWSDVAAIDPPELLSLVARGAAGSISVRTITPRTGYAAGFATMGAGARLEAGAASGALAAEGDSTSGALAPEGDSTSSLARGARVAALEEMRDLAEDAGYDALPGALAETLDVPLVAIGNADLGIPAPTPGGTGRWSSLVAMDADGAVEYSATSPDLLEQSASSPFGVRTDRSAIRSAVDAALAVECSALVIDHGDLERADRMSALGFEELRAERRAALLAADELLGYVRDQLNFERDLLLVVSPTSPDWDVKVHLGVAIALGPGFSAGTTIRSPSTRRRGIVTLPDVAPTVLDHAGIETPAEMNGRPWFSVAAPPDRISAAVDLDKESVFVEGLKGPISAWFIVLQVIVYALALALLRRRESKEAREGDGSVRVLETAGLAVAAFPIATFLGGIVKAHELGSARYVVLLFAIDVLLVALASLAFKGSLDRLLALSVITLAVMLTDLVFGGRLQLNTVFGYSPVVAGRFAGAGNIAFAVIAASAVLTGALIVHRWRSPLALWAVAALFGVVVVIDGAPMLGSDVGGVLALVPGLGLTWLLLSGRRPTLGAIGVGLVAAIAALAIFLAIDLGNPPASRTHLGRFFVDVRERGFEIFFDTIRRKAESSLRLFRTTIWTFFVPPALAVLAWLLARPSGRWERFAAVYPKLRAGLVGGLVLAVLGFAVNDSGIVIPAVMLSFLVPMALLVHLTIDRGERPA